MAIAACRHQPLRFDLSTRAAFAELTFPAANEATPPQLPRPAPQFAAFALLQDFLAGPWASPSLVGVCLSGLDGGTLSSLGEALTETQDYDGWGQRALALAGPIVDRCGVDPIDRLQLVWAISKASVAVYGQAQVSTLDAGARTEQYLRAAEAVKDIARIVARAPDAGVDLAAPVLALSGGSANGAFTAGFLYELLTSREEALADAGPDPALDEGSRFRATVGTSVGAVLSQLLELYSINDDAGFSPSQREALVACLDRGQPAPRPPPVLGGDGGTFTGWPDEPWPVVDLPSTTDRPRLAQRCALTRMEVSFSETNEASFLCAEPGSITTLMGVGGKARPNFIRFDTLQRTLFDLYVSPFATLMMKNGLDRVVVTSEFQQSQSVGLDELACEDAPDAGACLSSQLQASLVLPLFAAPVRHTYTGLTRGGECGVFYDGGLRSVLPALRALARSRPLALTSVLRSNEPRLRVLAIDNGRLVPVPAGRVTTITDALLGGLGQFTNEIDTGEVAVAQQTVLAREAELTALDEAEARVTDGGTTPLLPEPPLRPIPGPPLVEHPLEGGRAMATVQRTKTTGTLARAASLAPVQAPGSYIHPVYVPAEVPSWIIFGAGYSFDPTVMRGLFIWGRYVAQLDLAHDGSTSLLDRLGWPPEVVAGIREASARHAADPRFTAWLKAFSKDIDPRFRVQLGKAGRDRMLDLVPACEAVPPDAPRDGGTADAGVRTTAPSYFACPADALDLGAR